MAYLIISHSVEDRPIAEQIGELLRAAGLGVLDRGSGMDGDPGWERELYVQLRRADGVVFLASRASVKSRWRFAELSLARSLNRPVLPVRLDPGARLELLNDVQWVEFDDAESAVGRLLAGVRELGISASDSFAWDARRPPYPGLVSFAPEVAAVFFGRTREADRLVELLQPTLQGGSGRFVAVVGPSGSGKSSLVRAGLLPRLQRAAGRWVLLPPLVPGTQPTRNLAACFISAFACYGRTHSVDELVVRMSRDPGGLRALADELADLGRVDGRLPSVLVVIDQAEELLVRSGPSEQQFFLRTLRDALGTESPVWVVATLRSEYLSNAPERAGLAEAIDDTLVIEPLSRSRLGEVIEGPARRAGLEFAAGLVDRIVEDTAGGDAVPLLAYTLRELQQRAGPVGRITAEDYEALGGVVGALRGRAERVTAELQRDGRGPQVLPTLLQLATVSGAEDPTRRRVPRSSLSADEQVVIDAFVDAALLTTDNTNDEGATVEVAHEALLRQWAPLREAIESDRVALRQRSELERLAADWQEGHRDESYLLAGARLAAFEKWTHRDDRRLGDTEQQFLAASHALASRNLERTRRSNRRLRVLTIGLAVLLAVAATVGAVAWDQSRQTRAQSRLAWSRQLAVQADRMLTAQPYTAILVGLQSMSLARGQAVPPPAALVTALARVTHAVRTLPTPQAAQYDVAFSPTGTLIAAGGTDRTVRLWDVATGQPRGGPLGGHTEAVTGVAFSPDGKLLASASSDHTVRLWDVATGNPHGQPLLGHTDQVTMVAFSPDGRLLASVGNDHIVRLWDVATGSPHGQPLIGGETGVAFSPDGRLLAAPGTDATVRLWDVATGRPHGAPLTGHTGPAYEVAFSPDGTLLASVAEDASAQLWDVATGEPHGYALLGHTGIIYSVAFSPDGKLLVTTGNDRTVRLWDTATGKAHGQPLLGHTGPVYGAAFSPDGKLLATASGDATVRLWTVRDSYSLSQQVAGDGGVIYQVRFSPDGKLLATAGQYGVGLWDAVTGLPYGPTPTGHQGIVWGLAFSPDGRLLASAGEDGTVRLWDVATGMTHGSPLVGPEGSVTKVSFSPDGRLLATVGTEAEVRLWDVATGRPHGTPLAGGVQDVAFSPDGTLLAAFSKDQAIQLWDVATGRLHRRFTGPKGSVWTVSFSPDGRLLASTGTDRTVRLWDVVTGREHGRPLIGHTDTVYAAAFSPDGSLLASAGADRSVRLWDVATGRQQGPPLTGHTDGLNTVTFNRTGTFLATGSMDKTIRLWRPQFSTWVQAGCELVDRNLSMAEWTQIAPGLPYERTCPNLPSGTGAPPDADIAGYDE